MRHGLAVPRAGDKFYATGSIYGWRPSRLTYLHQEFSTAQLVNLPACFPHCSILTGAAASPRRPTAVILTTTFRSRFYKYIQVQGVVSIKVSENTQFTYLNPHKMYSKKKQKLDINLKIVPKYQLLHIKSIKKNK